MQTTTNKDVSWTYDYGLGHKNDGAGLTLLVKLFPDEELICFSLVVRFEFFRVSFLVPFSLVKITLHRIIKYKKPTNWWYQAKRHATQLEKTWNSAKLYVLKNANTANSDA